MDSQSDSGSPDIFEYLDYRAFLRDWMEHRKEHWPDFSYEYFTRRAGLGSRATLHNVIAGRRNPRPDTIDAFAKAMELSELESAYLQKLVELALTRTLDERREVLNSIVETPDFNKSRRIEGQTSEEVAYLISKWYCQAIWEMARSPDFRPDPAWLAQIMVPSVTVEQARESLEMLFNAGLLHRAEDGQIQVREIRLGTGQAPKGEAIYEFYRQLLENAAYSLDNVAPDERCFLGNTFLLPEGLIHELKIMLEHFNQQVAAIGDEANLTRSRVYQLGVVLFPLSRAPDEIGEGEG